MSVRIVFPTAWDRQQLTALQELGAGLPAFEYAGPDDADCRWDFDTLGMIDDAVAGWRGRVQGVFSSSDYPGAAVAAAIAAGLELPASTPASLLRTANKALARAVQAELVPEATPRFQVLDPERFDERTFELSFPCFVKPAKGSFSQLARRIDGMAQLRAFLASKAVHEHRHGFLRIWRELLQRYLGPEVDGSLFVAEELIRGELCTVEGFIADGTAEVLGIVDSVRDERTGSFTAFQYPSALPEDVLQRMREVACRLAEQHGLRWTMFNVELMWDRQSGRTSIIEINPRICGQFADLYHKVDGVHGYRVALELALGVQPEPVKGRGAHAFAASFPLRVFEAVRVVRAPTVADVAAARALFPGTLVWSEAREGEELADLDGEDGSSIRHGVVNLGAPSRKALRERRDAVLRALDWRFERLDS